MNARKICSVVLSVIMIGLGIYCMLTPDVAYSTLAVIIGIGILIDAIGKIYNWWYFRKKNDVSDVWLLVGGILSVVVALFLLTDGIFQYALDLTIAYVTAAWILVAGIIWIMRSFKIRDIYKKIDIIGRRWWVALVFGIILAVVGVLSLINPTALILTIGFSMGLVILVGGCGLLTFALM